MTLKEPQSMDECVYFTRRTTSKGKIVAWVFRETCIKCKKALMGKPKDEKTGKAKIRAKEYTCPACNYTIDKDEYEDSLQCNVQYTCPQCQKSGELQVPFHRKKVKLFDEEEQKNVSVEAVLFPCAFCSEKIAITKKMK
ncbi:hypothetical protein J4410_06555 [Candidatus Woesearchaeota archaeon]|nr:hypothetical protein [Candidatus Woesearchaeota archaeon]